MPIKMRKAISGKNQSIIISMTFFVMYYQWLKKYIVLLLLYFMGVVVGSHIHCYNMQQNKVAKGLESRLLATSL